MWRFSRCSAGVLVMLFALPAAALAQAAITGVVRDTSGAVLPGVTVEAASPVLIENARARSSATPPGSIASSIFVPAPTP